jgi:hypothetical protein
MPGIVQFGGKARARGAQLEPAQITVTMSVANASNAVARIEGRDFLTRFDLQKREAGSFVGYEGILKPRKEERRGW